MIRRSPRPQRFTVTDNRVLEDERLSFKAMGVLVYLLSKPDDWTVNREHLASTHTEGVSAVRAALVELRDAGYITNEKQRDDAGRLAGEIAVVHDSPVGGFPAGRSPAGGKPTALVKTEVPSTEAPNRSARATPADAAVASLPGLDVPQPVDAAVDERDERELMGRCWGLVRAAWEAREHKPIESRKATATVVRRLLEAGWPERQVAAALRSSPAWTPTSLQVELARGGRQPGRPSTRVPANRSTGEPSAELWKGPNR